MNLRIRWLRMRFLISVVLLIVCNAAFSASQTVKIKQIGVLQDNGNIYALGQLDGALNNTPSCASGFDHQVSFKIEDDFGKLMYSTILSAVAAGRDVYVDYSASTCGLWGSRPVITRVDLK